VAREKGIDMFSSPTRLQMIIRDYITKWTERGKWVMPDRVDALGFITTELGEAWDAHLRNKGGYVRNNPGNPDESFHVELGDIAFMCYVLAEAEGVDLQNIIAAKLAKMDRKKVGNG